MKPTLCIDVDSTIWNTGAWVCAAVLEVTGETLDVNEVTTWSHVLDTYGEETTTIVFDHVFDPARIHEREPYPDTREVLRALQESSGIRIHFVTHNDPEIMPPLLAPWLETHFGPNVGLTVTMGDKLVILKELEAFGLIDDRPDTIERVANAGLWAATKIQPWNRDLVARRSDVHGFDRWRELPDLLPPSDQLSNTNNPKAESEGQRPEALLTSEGLRPERADKALQAPYRKAKPEGRSVLMCVNAMREGGVLEREEAENTEGMREDAPQMTGFFGRGSLVTVSARTGVDLEGYVCDQNESGLLLDARDPSGDPTGYEFLPWSSIERVSAG